MDILDSLDTLLRTFWYIALPTSLVFLIQTFMTFIGADSSDGLQHDLDGDFGSEDTPFQLFSLRNLINFLLGFSWTGISLYSSVSNKTFLTVIAILVGVLFVYFFFLVIKQIQKLAEDNTFNIANTLHKSAEVYLTIPENKSGKGKVIISVNGSFHELEAMTESKKIPSGATVKVVRIENNDILIVEPI